MTHDIVEMKNMLKVKLLSCQMLWSQIKLTSYDFIDLHINGEFDNRPDTGQFLRIFSSVVTYRTGAGRRLYMKTSAEKHKNIVFLNVCCVMML